MQNQEQAEQKPKPKSKKDKPPSKEEVRAAVAAVVLTELEMWPEEIQVFIGEDHPNEDSFDRGVPYVIGAYMHIARKKARARFDDEESEIGKIAAREIGPIAVELQDQQRFERQYKEDAIAELDEMEKMEIEETVREIKLQYEHLRSEVRSEPTRSDTLKMCEEKSKIEAEHKKLVTDLHIKRNLLMKAIQVIDEAAGDWNSKGRKAKRKAHRQAKENEVTS